MTAGALHRAAAAPLAAVAVEPSALWPALTRALGDGAAASALAEGRVNLIAPVAVLLDPAQAGPVTAAVSAIHRALSHPAVRCAALALARARGLAGLKVHPGILGFDFHLTADGPRLIEINTNPGGLLIAAAHARAVRACRPELCGLPTGDLPLDHLEQQVGQVFAAADPKATAIAIVDDAPAGQHLYPEFLLYRRLFQALGRAAWILDPRELSFVGGSLRCCGDAIALVYNRLTDFMLTAPEHAALAAAWRAGAVRLIPDPPAHAVYSDKRLLSLLCDFEALRALGLPEADAASVAQAVPRTAIASTETWGELWERRRNLFFKPVKGYAGKAAYRGDKISRTTWESLHAEDYVVQDFTPAPRLRLPCGGGLKADLRAFARDGRVVLLAARLYEGQITNFRTPGGGFAPVFIDSRPPAG